jgi:hypothetical protein
MLKARDTLGKYRIIGRVGKGGFATVYRAYDTIEGVRVALKIPHSHLVDKETLNDFRSEVRITAGLDHPNILPMKTASFIGKRFVIVYPLGEATLAERLKRRLAGRTALVLAEQLLEAAAYAHERRIIHCDIKPENLILFPDNRVRLTDFGIAKVALRSRTLIGGGTGTFGYLAPEQGIGRPSLRSDVFALGLVIYRMFSGSLPEWPYDWPPVGFARLRRNVHPDFVSFLRRAMELDERARYADAGHMLTAFRRIKKHALRTAARRRRAKVSGDSKWRTVRMREFRRRYGRALEARHACGKCGRPVAESMFHCPWCGTARQTFRGSTRAPARCRRCGRGIKRDWPFCAWCYGGRVQQPSDRHYSDVRYVARCGECKGDLMPFMRYCPWCRTKVTRRWKIEHVTAKCSGCGWGVLPDYWVKCPWCGRKVGK